MAPRPVLVVAIVVILLAAVPGCVQRTIKITSEPSGALVWLNDREIGRTPVDVEFVHYGTYDVRLVRDGYEALLTSGDAMPPWWDNVGLDLVAEVLPLELTSHFDWHFELEPAETEVEAGRAELVDRANAIRERLAEEAMADR
ncbi:MAG: PEGA domain-containing protein [Planctomycetes bacterium]|nr:PEGA domain-containing protein [Planctomycetota bacterium]